MPHPSIRPGHVSSEGLGRGVLWKRGERERGRREQGKSKGRKYNGLNRRKNWEGKKHKLRRSRREWVNSEAKGLSVKFDWKKI